MPVIINQFESQVEVDSAAPQGEPAQPEAQGEAQQRWQGFYRQQVEQDMRTAAWGFDD